MEPTFVIDFDLWLPDSGGVVALHKLCQDICDLGYASYITCPSTHPKLNITYIPKSEVDRDNMIVIYPEITIGNPLNAKNVIRWILNTPGRCSAVSKEAFYSNVAPTDRIFKYSSFFEYDGNYDGLLTTSYVDYDTFNNRQLCRDIESCFLIKKGGISECVHPANSVNLSPHQNNWDYMSEIFNRSKYFYCYDNECFWVGLAALCGCITVVCPNTTITFEEWANHFKFNKYGIAFGLDNLQHAVDTLPLVFDHFKFIQNEDLKTVKSMVNYYQLL